MSGFFSKTLRQGGTFDAFLLILVIMGVLFSLFVPLSKIIYHVNNIELSGHAEVTTYDIKWAEIPKPLKENVINNLCELLNLAGGNSSLNGNVAISGTITLSGRHYTPPIIIFAGKYEELIYAREIPEEIFTEESNYLYLNRLYESERARYSYEIKAFCERLEPIEYGAMVPIRFRVYYDGVEAPGVVRYYSTSERLSTYYLRPVRVYLDRYLIGGVLFNDGGFEAMAASFAILVFTLLIVAYLVKTGRFSFTLLAYAYLLIAIVLIIITIIDYYTFNGILAKEKLYPRVKLYDARIVVYFMFSNPSDAFRLIGVPVNYVQGYLWEMSLEHISVDVEGGPVAIGLSLRLILLVISIIAAALYSKLATYIGSRSGTH